MVAWQNRLLNEQQRAAVRAVVSGQHTPLPFIIYGPPGTGKTSTLIEAAVQVGGLGTATLSRNYLQLQKVQSEYRLATTA